MDEFGNNINENSSNQPTKNKRGPYKKLERLHTQHEIEHLLIEGYDSAYIMQKFNLPQTSFYRYRNAAFQEEKNILVGLSLDTLLEQIVLCDKRLAHIGSLAKDISQDKSIEGVDRVSALNLAAEIERARLRVYLEGPSCVSQTVRAYPQSEIKANETLRKELEIMKNTATMRQQQRQLPQFQSEASTTNNNTITKMR